MTHNYDWSKAKPPWNEIGPKWRREISVLSKGLPPPPNPQPRPHALEAGLKGVAARRGMTVAEVKARYNDRMKAAINATR
jgi:hypothetical protein